MFRVLALEGFAEVFLGLLIALLLPVDVAACSCARTAAPREALKQRDAVFSGMVVAADTTNSQRGLRVTMEVDKIWKGEVGRREVITTALGGATCGYPFRIDEQYLIYADASDGGFSTHLCTRTVPLARAQIDLWAFEHGGGLCGTPVDAVSAQIFLFLMLGLAIGRWPVYL